MMNDIIFDSKIRSILVVVFLYLMLHKECDLNLIGNNTYFGNFTLHYIL